MDEDVAKSLASQLARPSGEGGVEITTMMNALNAFITARALEALGASAGESVLEVGPGNGQLSLPMLEALGEGGRYLGVEYEADIATIAAAALGEMACDVDVRSGDFMGHAPVAASVDGLMAVNVLYFIEDLAAFAARCAAWLRPAGRVVFGVRSQLAIAGLPFAEHGFRIRSVDELFRALTAAGFENIEAKFFDEGTSELDGEVLVLDTIIVSAKRPPAA